MQHYSPKLADECAGPSCPSFPIIKPSALSFGKIYLGQFPLKSRLRLSISLLHRSNLFITRKSGIV
tara:strand:+ start:247 stop:444 length:198 start_codon:yes stop_codon:yes gene_type:complete